MIVREKKSRKQAAFSERHPMYRCSVCNRQTRLTDEMSDQWDAEFNKQCITCWDEGTLSLEHEFFTNMPQEYDHPNQADCPECK